MYRFRSFIWVVVFGLTCIGYCHAQQSDINNPFLKMNNSNNSRAILFAPVTYIGYVEKGDKIQHSDSISNETAAILTQKTKDLREQLKVDSILATFDTATSNTIQYELNNVVNDENFSDKKKKITLPPFLDSLLMESGHTYGMIFYQNGFLRKKGNYGKQVWKSVGFALLTLGSYTEVTQKASANLYLFWLDGKKKTISCIGQAETQDKEPTDNKLLDKQLQTIIENKNKKED